MNKLIDPIDAQILYAIEYNGKIHFPNILLHLLKVYFKPTNQFANAI